MTVRATIPARGGMSVRVMNLKVADVDIHFEECV
jgi:hypothetical protein